MTKKLFEYDEKEAYSTKKTKKVSENANNNLTI